jgi:transcriptional regulator with XRE-family HTH domain
MKSISDNLRQQFKDPEIAEGYAESFLDSYIATQIKVLREQHNLSQRELAEKIGTKQGAISRIEDVNYSKWNVTTLKKLARVFHLRLKVSFETYGTLIDEVEHFSRQGLQRAPRENDPALYPAEQPAHHPGSRRPRGELRLRRATRSATERRQA